MSEFHVDQLLSFIQRSPSPYHACAALARMFREAGFAQLDEKEPWDLSPGQGYFYTRADTSFVAFRYGESLPNQGLRLVGAHTDSPCLKLKPSPDLNKVGYAMLGVEVYGGALLNPWFDRDLSLAGKVSGLNTLGELDARLVDFVRPIATIPSLAIHLNREANKNKSTNAQKEMNALLCENLETSSFRDCLLQEVNKKSNKNTQTELTEIFDIDLRFYDTQAPRVIGLQNSFIAAARLDNLLSCFLAAQALLSGDTAQTSVLICNDHEEVGSRSEAGAQGTMLNDLVSRLCPEPSERQRALRHSMMFSVDNAHGIHPNYPERHDDSHGPLINQGPVIKHDANQSYATSTETASVVRWLAAQGETIPLQDFVTRADMRCGSTIGPITATNLGIRTVDIGNAQFAMHSCREMAGVKDADYMAELIRRFYALETVPF